MALENIIRKKTAFSSRSNQSYLKGEKLLRRKKCTSLFTKICTLLFTEKCTFLFTKKRTLLFADYYDLDVRVLTKK
jgi:hypothetical protein